MAIKAKFSKNGPDILNAYFKITMIQGSKESGLKSTVNVYYDKSYRDLNADPVNAIEKNIPWDGTGNPYNIIYNALKIDFSDATDI